MLPEESLDMIKEKLCKGDVFERIKAVEALAKQGGTDSFDLLVASLRGQDWRVINAATVQLKLLGDKRAVEPLINALNEENLSNLANIVGALGILGDVRAVNPLLSILQRKPNRYVVLALGKIGDSRAVKPLISLINNRDYSLHSAVVIALRQFDDRTALEPLIAYIKRGDEVYHEDIYTLGKLGGEAVIDLLIKILTRRSSDTRVAAAEELGRLGDSTVSPMLEIVRSFKRSKQYWILPFWQDGKFVERRVSVYEAATDALKKIEARQK